MNNSALFVACSAFAAVSLCSDDESCVCHAQLRNSASRIGSVIEESPATTGKENIVLKGHSRAIQCFALSPDEKRLLSGSEDNTARLWDLTKNKSLVLSGNPSMPLSFLGQSFDISGGVNAVAFSSDGKYAFTGAQSSISIWDLQGKDVTKSYRLFPGHRGKVEYLHVTPDGKRLISVDENGFVRIWDWQSKKPATDSVLFRAHKSCVSTCRLIQNGKYLLTAGCDSPTKIWDVNAEDPEKSAVTLKGHKGGAKYIAVSGDSKTLVAYGNEIDLATLFSQDSENMEPSIRSWDLSNLGSKRNIESKVKSQLPEDSFPLLIASNDGKKLFRFIEDNVIQEADWKTLKLIGPRISLNEGGTSFCAWQISRNGRFLVTGGHRGELQLWDLSGKTKSALQADLKGHAEGSVRHVAFSSDEKRIISGAYDKTLRIWNVEQITSKN